MSLSLRRRRRRRRRRLAVALFSLGRVEHRQNKQQRGRNVLFWG